MKLYEAVAHTINDNKSYIQGGAFIGLVGGFAMLYFGVPYAIGLGLASMATYFIPVISSALVGDRTNQKPTPPNQIEWQKIREQYIQDQNNLLESSLKIAMDKNEQLEKRLAELNQTIENFGETLQPVIHQFVNEHIRVQRARNHLNFDNMTLLIQDVLQRVNTQLPPAQQLTQVDIERIFQNPERYPNHGQLAIRIRDTIREHQTRVLQRDNANAPPQPNVNLANNPNALFQGVEPRANQEQTANQNPQPRVA